MFSFLNYKEKQVFIVILKNNHYIKVHLYNGV